MTRTGSTKAADAAHALGRLRRAMASQEVAKLSVEDGSVMLLGPDAVSSNAILSVIAYADALTAAYGGRVNQKDHGAVIKLLRDTLGSALPAAQERRLAKLIGRKDETQYGSKPGRAEEARQFVEALDVFAAWARETLARRSISVVPSAEDGADG